jgi:hypothetical protein
MISIHSIPRSRRACTCIAVNVAIMNCRKSSWTNREINKPSGKPLGLNEYSQRMCVPSSLPENRKSETACVIYRPVSFVRFHTSYWKCCGNRSVVISSRALERKRHAEAAPTVQNSNSDSRSLTAARSKASGSKLPPHHSSSCSWSS